MNAYELMLHCDRLVKELKEADKHGHISNVLARLSFQETNECIPIAVRKGWYKVLISLIGHIGYLPIEYIDEKQNNLLHLVLHSYTSGHRIGNRDELLQCVIKLVEAGVDINHLNHDNKTPICIAATKGLCNVVIYLADHCGDLPLQYIDDEHNNLFHLVLHSYRSTSTEGNRMIGDVFNNYYKQNTLLGLGDFFNNYYKQNTLLGLGAVYNNYTPTYLGHRGGYEGDSDDLLRCVIKLVECGVDVNALNKDNQTPILIATTKGLYNVVICLIDHRVDLPLQYIDDKGNNLLHLVLHSYTLSHHTCGTKEELLQCVIKLVEAGVDVNAMNKHNQISISIAADKRLYTVVIDLIDRRADLQYIDDKDNNLLHLVLHNYRSTSTDDTSGNSDELSQCVIRLVEAGVDVNYLNQDNQTPIFIAARNKMHQLMIYLLEHGAQVHCIDIQQNNLLHVVLGSYVMDDLRNNVLDDAGYDERDMDSLLNLVIKLVEAGVDVNHLNKSKKAPIFIAAHKMMYSIVTYLLSHGASVHCLEPKTQNNLLHVVLNSVGYDKGDMDTLLSFVVKLVEAGIDVNHLNKDKQAPLVIAASNRLYQVVISLLGNGARVDYLQANTQNNLLHIILDYFKEDEGNTALNCVIKLVEAGVDVNHLNKDKRAPIFIAARKRLYQVIVSLLENGARVHYLEANTQNNLLHLVLDGASYNKGDVDGLLTCVVKLVEAGVEVNHLNIYKQTPIFIAVHEMLYNIVTYLLDHGASVHYVDIKGHNILQCVLYNIYELGKGRDKNTDIDQYSDGCTQVVKTLINMGVDVNKVDIDGNTPLFYKGRKLNMSNLDLFQKEDILFRLQYELIAALINAGCNVNHQNNEGQTPLMYYTRNQADISILKMMIPHSDVNLTDNNGNTACSYCVQYHVFNCTNIFKLYSRDALMSPNNGVKLLHQILACKRLELFNYFMGLRLIINGVTTDGENLLHLLARVNYDYSLDKFNWLFNDELDTNHPSSKTNTPIMIAALLLNSKYLELFTRHPRIDINAQNNHGHTALHLCIIGFTMVKDALNNRQENDVVENYCRQIYPIYMECVDTLLAAVGRDVNIADRGGRTALMMAAMKNDRFLIRKLLNAGAMVNYNGKSALRHLDICESVFDLSFKKLVSAGDNMLLNLPCINGSTLIQATLCFPRCWDPHTAVSFIKYLVSENCCLQSLVTSFVESSYNQIDMMEFNSQERNTLRKLLYLSGAPEKEVVTALNFEKEDTNVEKDNMRRLLNLRGVPEEEILQHLNFRDEDEHDPENTFHSRHREIFSNYCCNISLKSQCRRIVRQKLGLGIKEKVIDLELPGELIEFILLKDVLNPKDFYVDNIEDCCNDYDDDDGYGGYNINKDRDDDYNYEYFTLLTDDTLLYEYEHDSKYPNGKHILFWL
ncbi:serine/threonine-protein phosphatase 6 regulatory ankyrin repeat subunit A-like [Patella vulgata]|uniref:serine/threonine-protein phosphatase 6 regulatory ankyrin repeat subunit A-like n=1 Tax=Patella vulgata TaxID=6465 RepID=UPI0024A83C8A|nr:serine/threonine-protein phosphatase 6 regulatory ankyrin repeat subunit A-like [Patella vulgata]